MSFSPDIFSSQGGHQVYFVPQFALDKSEGSKFGLLLQCFHTLVSIDL